MSTNNGQPRGFGNIPKPLNCSDCGVWTASGKKRVGPRCHACYKRWVRAGRPAPEVVVHLRLTSAAYSYSTAYGTARLDLAS